MTRLAPHASPATVGPVDAAILGQMLGADAGRGPVHDRARCWAAQPDVRSAWLSPSTITRTMLGGMP